MTTLYGTQMAKLRVAPQAVPEPGFVDGTVRVFNEKIALSGQTTTDVIEVARLPKGAVPLYGLLLTDTSLGAATVAIGVSGNAGKYRTGGTFTVTDAPTPFGAAAGAGEALSAEESVFISIGAASLPVSGTLRVMFFYSFN